MTRMSALLAALTCFFFYTSCTNKIATQSATSADLTQYVDPFIGSGFHGHVFVGANRPFGAVQLGPKNMSEGWDWCSGYHISDSTIRGFVHTALSGTGIGDLGDISLMPVTGDVAMAKGQPDNYASGYFSLFSHDEETARPGYYAVKLKRYGIDVELTASERVGFHRYAFPAERQPKVIIDLESGTGWDRPVKTFIEKVNDSTVRGYRYSSGWAADQRVFFTAVFSQPFESMKLYDSISGKSGDSLTARRVKAEIAFGNSSAQNLMVKVGISPVSAENAAANIETEIPDWNFDRVRQEANDAWNHELAKIAIETPDTARLRTFYTAVYHTLIAPSIFNDHNGDYRGTNKKVYHKADFTNLTTFSLWDTYRAAHPLYTIFQADRVNDMVQSMLMIYEQQGKLPVWHLMGNETNTMPGHSGVQVVADAYLKGFRGFDTSLVWEALKTSVMGDDRGMKYVKELGFIPADSMVESVAMGLEYAISDWAVAAVAKEMGKKDEYAFFSERAKAYKHYFDPETKFMRGRVSQTEWRTPFSPFQSTHRRDDYSEGNAWQYTWLVPHDVEGLIALMGGPEYFEKKLDSLFTVEGFMGEEASNDITGLIGQYAHGNEPGHHTTYLYNFVGKNRKTADKIRYILDHFYTDKPDGIIGNEDVGQMSAWYILSTLGMYQVNPADGRYHFGSPNVDRAVLRLDNGKTFAITVKNNSRENKYIESVKLNGKPFAQMWIGYEDIMAGGELEFVMGK